MRPAGWTDGSEWRDPVPVAPHLHPWRDRRTILGLLAVEGRRTRVEPCPRCSGAIVEDDDGSAGCTRRGGCGWYRMRSGREGVGSE